MMELEKKRTFPTMKRKAAAFVPNSPVEALNAGFFVSPGFGRHPTRSIGSHELIFVKSGRLGLFEEDCVIDASAGQAIFLCADLRHGGVQDYKGDLKFYWLHFHLKKPSGKRGQALRLPFLSTPKRPERLEELIRIFLDDQEQGVASKQKANALMELILLETLETRSESLPSGSDESLAASAENIMKARFCDSKFGASALARELKCNPDYLNRVFKRARGMTLTAHIRRLRVNCAAQALLSGNVNVDEAAQLSGFNDRSYLRRVFRQLKGMSPKDYRRLHLKMHINTR